MNPDPFTGRILSGKYRLGALIGRGAVGRVYRATQLCLDREVAIKILNPTYAKHPEAVGRFRLEASAASRLCHPGIVTVLDWGEDPEGLLFLVIEYMPGVDLFDIAEKQAPLASSRIAKLMEQAARALFHAHDRGVIHRDLKPENLRVMTDPAAPLGAREILKIFDFGIAHVARQAITEGTQAGALVGTPYYMSPEQAAAARVVPESDLYACGIIMFLLSTGRLPFVGASPLEVASMHLRERPPRPSRFNPSIDPRLERIILQCLAKRPADRPRSGMELAGMLAQVAATPRSLHLAPPPLPPDFPRPSRAPKAPLRWTTAWAIGATSALGAMLTNAWVHAPSRGDGVALCETARAAADSPAQTLSANGPIPEGPARPSRRFTLCSLRSIP